MENKITLALIACLCVWLSACTFAKHKKGDGDQAATVICTSQIDFLVIQQTILGPKCLSCHGAGAGNLNLDTYAAVQANFAKIQSFVQSGAMPPGKPLSAGEKSLLTSWESAGLPQQATAVGGCDESGSDVVPVPVPVLAPNFESISKLILQPRCVACHGDGDRLDFSTYSKLVSQTELFKAKPGEDSDFVEAVASGFMPPKNPKLTEVEVSIIRQWVILGLPEREDTVGIIINPGPQNPPVETPPQEPPIVGNPLNPLPEDLSCLDFKTISATILQPKCVGCHGSAGGVNLESYAAVTAHLSKVETMVATGRMPPQKPLEPVLKAQLLAWIKNGAPESTASCAPPTVEPAPPLEATYNSMRTHFLEQKCIVCHSGPSPSAVSRKNGDGDDDDDDDHHKPDFSTYKKMIANKKLFNFKEPHKSKIVDEVLDGEMPPSWSSAKALTDVEIETLIEWIKRGLPEG